MVSFSPPSSQPLSSLAASEGTTITFEPGQTVTEALAAMIVAPVLWGLSETETIGTDGEAGQPVRRFFAILYHRNIED